jgi:PAS domain-containing protein
MQQEIEVILARHLASSLYMPMVIVDVHGDMLFYNPPAEKILGWRFEDSGTISVEQWTRIFLPLDEEGNPLPAEQLPLVITLTHRRPSFRRFRIHSRDGVVRRIEVTAIPLLAQADRFLGAAAIFWETKQP